MKYSCTLLILEIFTKIHKWLDDCIAFMACDYIAFIQYGYGQWLYSLYFYKYLQIIQPQVGDTLGFWDDKCIQDWEILLIFLVIMWSQLTGIINMEKLSYIYIQS